MPIYVHPTASPGGFPGIIPIRTRKTDVATSKITFFQNFKVVACVVQYPLGDCASKKEISPTQKNLIFWVHPPTGESLPNFWPIFCCGTRSANHCCISVSIHCLGPWNTPGRQQEAVATANHVIPWPCPGQLPPFFLPGGS